MEETEQHSRRLKRPKAEKNKVKYSKKTKANNGKPKMTNA